MCVLYFFIRDTEIERDEVGEKGGCCLIVRRSDQKEKDKYGIIMSLHCYSAAADFGSGGVGEGNMTKKGQTEVASSLLLVLGYEFVIWSRLT